jgi:DNA-binding NtrC family response regulator
LLLVENFCHELGYTSEAIPVKRLAELPRSDFPGNVAELKTLVKRLILGEVVDKRAAGGPMPTIEEMGLVLDFRDIVVSLARFADAKDEVVARFEKAYVTFAIAAHGGHVAKAAASSGLSARYFNIVRARSRTEP